MSWPAAKPKPRPDLGARPVDDPNRIAAEWVWAAALPLTDEEKAT